MGVIIAELIGIFKSQVFERYRGIAQKLSHLDMLVTKIRSVIEVSEQAEIKSKELRKLQEIFKDHATQGEEVLHKLRPLINSSSSSSSSDISTSFQGFVSWTDGEKLSSTIKLLERDSAEVKDFIKIFKFERLSEANNERCGELVKGVPRKRKCKAVVSTGQLQSNEVRQLIRDLPSKLERREMEVAFGPGSPLRGCRRRQGKYLEVELLSTRNRDEFAEVKALAQGQFQSYNPGNLLSTMLGEQVAEVEALAATIQSAVDMAKPNGEDDSWFGRWIAKMREAINEANSVALSIKSHDSCVDDQILDEVRAILTNVHQRLENMVNDLEDSNSLAEAKHLVREL